MIVTDTEIFNSSVPDLPSKDEVVELCRRKGIYNNHLIYTTPNGKTFFIKYNNARMAEAHALLFFSSSIKANLQSTIRIPELYHAWLQDQSSSAYLVMEYIDIGHFASDEERASALTELIAVNPPPGVFGSFWPPDKHIRHLYFKYQESAKLYSSAQELQDSINELLQTLPAGNHGTVDFSDEPLMCYHSDIYRENFPSIGLVIFGSLISTSRACFRRALQAGLSISRLNTLYLFLFARLYCSAGRRT